MATREKYLYTFCCYNYSAVVLNIKTRLYRGRTIGESPVSGAKAALAQTPSKILLPK